MKTKSWTRTFCTVLCLCFLTVPAAAWEGTPLKCYDKVLMSAKLKVWKELVTPAREQYEHRHGQVQKVRYPAVYKERVEVLEPPFYLLKERPCRH